MLPQPYFQSAGTTLYHADFQTILPELAPGSIGAVITDPPYPKAYLPLWRPLAALSSTILAPGGSLLSIVPHYAAPQILATVSEFLKWRWMLSMIQSAGAHPRMAMGIEVGWKPIGWWVKGSWPNGRGFRKDWFKNQIAYADRREKLHKWEQSLGWAEYCLKFVPDGELVVDPMAGAGTLLQAAQTAGHPAIGIDNDEQACETTAKRLEALVRQAA